MINKILYILLAFFIFSCGDEIKSSKKQAVSSKSAVEKSRDNVVAQIEEFSDSLFKMTMKLYDQNNGLDKNARIALESKIIVVRQQYINENISFLNSFPKDTLVPYCFYKLNSIYNQMNAYEKSLACLDSILTNYPDFVYYSEVLEEKAGTLDLFIKPRDTALIRETYQKLLSLPDLPAHKIEDYNNRISNLDKDISEILSIN
jgi:tetratricopeptide (TPR) repeat protein